MVVIVFLHPGEDMAMHTLESHSCLRLRRDSGWLHADILHVNSNTIAILI